MQFPGHLHVHSEYSPLDGLASIEELVQKAKQLGQEFIAITDHGSSSGLHECNALSKKYDIKILMGEEFYFHNPEELKNGHLILIAKNDVGLKNLFTLQTKAIEDFYYKPRISLDLLKEHHEGLICTSACIANQIGQYILMDEPHLALNHMIELRNIFGDDFYVELQSSTSPDVIKVNKKLLSVSHDHNFKIIITNDVHYVRKEDYKIHEVLLCIQQVKKMNDEKRWRFEHNDFWLKSGEEIEEYLDYLTKDEIQEAYKNLKEIADKCNDDLNLKHGNFLPKFCETPEEEDNLLSHMVWQSYLKGKIAERKENNNEFKNDLLKELKVISDTGYSGYFLIVHEYIKWARENGILVGDGRGSGAGCKVAYTIGITDVNPQKHNLLFERFLSPGREPDFDVDFSDTNAVFKHLQDVYGKENVARVGAFSRFTAKSAIRKVMSVFGFTMKEISEIIAMLPNRLTFTLNEALNESKALSNWFDEHSDLLKYVAAFEGKLEHFSTHAGGVIICNGLTEMLPIIHDKDDKDKMIVALDKKELEKLGHYKFDILGLKALTLMENILEYTGHIDWHNVDFEDSAIYDDLKKGDVLGIFQLADQREKVLEQQPETFEDLIAINALIRPGVCDWNEYLNARRKNVETDLPEYMRCTHGLIVYQDQYLQLAQTYAGWDIAFSDKHIRKNKDINNDIELKEKWLKDTGGMEDLWNTICGIVSGGYGFNRAHSTSYAMLTYQTAYMKHYYPKEFYAAYMTRNVGDSVKLYEAIKEARKKGIKIYPPDINESSNKFIPINDGIMMSLTSIKGIGESVVNEVERLKPIKNMQDLLDRRTKRFIKKNNLVNLIKAGCFKEAPRNELLKEYCNLYLNVPDYVHDREVFEFYISDSPFESYNLRPFSDYNEGNNVTTVLLPIDIAIRNDKNGNEMAFVQAINDSDSIKLIVFSSIWKNYKFKENELLLVKGRKDKGNLIINSVEPL